MKYEITEFEIDNVKGYEAKAGLVLDAVWHDAHIEFTVEFDNEIPIVQIESVWLNEDSKPIELEEQSLHNLAEAIEQNGNVLDWLSDARAALSDHYYDNHKENEEA